MLDQYWKDNLKEELVSFVGQLKGWYFPKKPLVALSVLPDNVKVLIVADSFYDQAAYNMGIPFAVPSDVYPKPPALVNIFKEIEMCGYDYLDYERSELTGWREQGVFLLSTDIARTTGGRVGSSVSDKIVKSFVGKDVAVVLVGGARKYKDLFPGAILVGSPDPGKVKKEHYSQRFPGSRIFSRVNEILTNKGMKPIDWSNT